MERGQSTSIPLTAWKSVRFRGGRHSPQLPAVLLRARRTSPLRCRPGLLGSFQKSHDTPTPTPPKTTNQLQCTASGDLFFGGAKN